LGGDFVFLFRSKLRLGVAGALFQLTHVLLALFFAALFLFGFTEEVRFEELIFSLNLLVVLFHGFEALDELFDG